MRMKSLYTITLSLYFVFSSHILANEFISKYFPTNFEIGNYWKYEDQDGNELYRYIDYNKEVDGHIYFSARYNPELENLLYYNPFIQYELYSFNIDHSGSIFYISNTIEDSLKAKLDQEAIFVKNTIENQTNRGLNVDIDINVTASDEFVFISDINDSSEWEVNEIDVEVIISFNDGSGDEIQNVIFDFNIKQRGKISGIESIKIDDKYFKDCLKIKYYTKTNVSCEPKDVSESLNLPGETYTTVWLAPDIGIVKLKQQRTGLLLDVVPINGDDKIELPDKPKDLIFEIKGYELISELGNED